MNGRHELKLHINASDYSQLRTRLQAVAKPDENAGMADIYQSTLCTECHSVD